MEDTQTRKDVQRLREGLGELPEPTITPAFIVVSGLPGSGKSYFCRQLAERLFSLSPRPLAPPFPILESDALRRLLFPTPNFGRGESDRLFRACHMLIEDLLRRGIALIFDATNLIEYHREHLYHIADSVGARLIIVRVEAPPELVRQRLQDRLSRLDQEDKSEADWRVYRRMSAAAQRIRRNHFAADTSRDITPVIDKI
ncbi:MAG: AAA family ATPase, partial [Dehalococcoidia bacterium]|nr:AAA family ATPase [Dehalococcoidia bacterium]